MMMIIRNLALNEPEGPDPVKEEAVESPLSEPEIEEFSVANYYLVRGNKLRFKVYPLVKKKGKCTGGIAGCVYEYDNAVNPLILWKNNAVQNETSISRNFKLDTVITFASMILKIDVSEVYQYDRLAARSESVAGETASPFDILKMMGTLEV